MEQCAINGTEQEESGIKIHKYKKENRAKAGKAEMERSNNGTPPLCFSFLQKRQQRKG